MQPRHFCSSLLLLVALVPAAYAADSASADTWLDRAYQARLDTARTLLAELDGRQVTDSGRAASMEACISELAQQKGATSGFSARSLAAVCYQIKGLGD